MSKFKNTSLYNKVIDWHIDNEVFEKVNLQQFSSLDKEVYCDETLMLLYSIDSAFDDLELNGKFISQYNNKDLFDILDVDKTAYLKYHLEYFYLEIPTIFDLSLRLINFIYKLNINELERDFKKKLYHDLTSEEVKSLIIEFDSEIKTIKRMRNLKTHANKFDEKNIELLRLTKHVKENSKNDLVLRIINESGDLINQQSYSNILEFTTVTKQTTYEYLTKLYNHLDEPFSNNLN